MVVRRALGLLLFAVTSFAMSGCYWFVDDAGPDVAEQAREDLSCDHVEARRVGPTYVSSCRSADFIVEGCGQIARYRCQAGTGCSYDCDRLESREQRSN